MDRNTRRVLPWLMPVVMATTVMAYAWEWPAWAVLLMSFALATVGANLAGVLDRRDERLRRP